MKSTNISRISILWNIFSERPFIIRNYRQNVFLSSCSCLQIQLLKVKNPLATGWAEKTLMPLFVFCQKHEAVGNLFILHWAAWELGRPGAVPTGRLGGCGPRAAACLCAGAPGCRGVATEAVPPAKPAPFARWRRGLLTPGQCCPSRLPPRIVRPRLQRGPGPTVLAVTSPRPLLGEWSSTLVLEVLLLCKYSWGLNSEKYVRICSLLFLRTKLLSSCNGALG